MEKIRRGIEWCWGKLSRKSEVNRMKTQGTGENDEGGGRK